MPEGILCFLQKIFVPDHLRISIIRWLNRVRWLRYLFLCIFALHTALNGIIPIFLTHLFSCMVWQFSRRFLASGLEF
jgi:hypothetical protein